MSEQEITEVMKEELRKKLSVDATLAVVEVSMELLDKLHSVVLENAKVFEKRAKIYATYVAELEKAGFSRTEAVDIAKADDMAEKIMLSVTGDKK